MIDSHRNQNSHNSLAHTEDVLPTKNYQENSTKIIQKTLRTEYIKSSNFVTKILKKISPHAREHLLHKSSSRTKGQERVQIQNHTWCQKKNLKVCHSCIAAFTSSVFLCSIIAHYSHRQASVILCTLY
jgi:hypothetical protein